MAAVTHSPLPVRLLGWIAAVSALGFVGLLMAAGIGTLFGAGDAFRFAVGSAMIVVVLLAAVSWLLWAIVDANLVTDGRWDLGTGVTRMIKIVGSVCVALVVLAIVPVGVLAATGSGTFDDASAGTAGILLVALIGAGLLGAAVAGGVALGGRNAAWIGVVFTFGFAALVAGTVFGEFWAVLVGCVALAVSLVGYYVVGADAGRLPASIASRYGDVGSALTGVVLATVGLIARQPFAILGGALIVAAFVGVRIARRSKRQSSPATPSR